MPKLSDLIAPRRAVYRFRGHDLNFDYDPALLTQEYIDDYSENAKKLSDENVKPSKKMESLRSNLSRQVKWIDVQGDNDKDLSPGEFISNLTWDELQEFDATIGEDVYKRQSPTPPTEGSSSTGSALKE